MPLNRFTRPVIVADEQELVASVARRMREERVGCVVVTRKFKPVGILTDRDVALRVVGEQRDAGKTRVSDIVTYGPFVLAETDEIETAVSKMREYGVRRLPIINAAGAVTGIVTADDLIILFGRELAALAEGFSESTDSSESR